MEKKITKNIQNGPVKKWGKWGKVQRGGSKRGNFLNFLFLE